MSKRKGRIILPVYECFVTTRKSLSYILYLFLQARGIYYLTYLFIGEDSVFFAGFGIFIDFVLITHYSV